MFAKDINYLRMVFLSDVIGEFFNKLIQFSLAQAMKQCYCLTKALSISPFLSSGLDSLVDIFHLIDDAVIETNVVIGRCEEFFAGFAETKIATRELEDIADHHFDCFANYVEVVQLVQFVPRMEDVVDCLDILGRVADLPVHDACLVH